MLILAYHFPPYTAVSAQRPWSWYKHFSKHGLFPVIITRNWNEELKDEIDYAQSDDLSQKIRKEEDANGVVMRVSTKPNLRDRLLIRFGFDRFSLFRRLLSLVYLFVGYFKPFDRSYPLYKTAYQYLAGNQVEAIIATGGPFVQFIYAQRLSQRFNIPWIADYRDNWSNNPDLEKLSIGGLQKWFLRRLERKCVRDAALITVASPSYTPLVQSVVGDFIPINVVYNGFQEDIFQCVGGIEADKSLFKVTYAGKIYSSQNLELFVEGFKRFVDCVGKEKVELTFYGARFFKQIENRIQHAIVGFEDVVNITEPLPYAELAEELRKSHVLVVLSDGKPYWLRAKLFDYMGAGRFILMVPGDDGVMQGILEDSGQGIVANSAEAVCEILEARYCIFSQYKEEHFSSIESFSREKQTERLAEYIKQLL